ncbi:hypothetical protein LOAG_03261 [Loa loa]|uniref:Uncharacterized protein n=1 Tax=Loa loa TaxID=7209 RepID=A0A1S0U5L7_LOALO|nr:hypothetical protein LOAG_03261 [Loa loa]EFO25221.2 hypothetical protein LOAG_03261 [Loa loa]
MKLRVVKIDYGVNFRGRAALIYLRSRTQAVRTHRYLQQVSRQYFRTLIDQKVFNSFESEIPSQTRSCAYGNSDEEMQEKLDQFKNFILDDIIQCGVYTDSVIQDCISRNILENLTLPMANLQQAITELLRDIGVFNIEMNKMTWIASSKSIDDEISYGNEEFENDEGESLSVIPSMGSDSDKLTKKPSNFGSVSVRTTDSSTTLSSSSIIDTFN